MIVLGGAKRKRTEDRLGSEQGDYEGQMPGGWAPSLKMVIKRKQKSLGTFNGTGYNKETSKSVRDLINVYEHPQERGTSSSSSWLRDLNRERLVEFTGKESKEYLSPVKRRRPNLDKGVATSTHHHTGWPLLLILGEECVLQP